MRWTRWKISELFKNLVEIIQRTMAKRKVWFGSVGPFLYDDERHKGVETDGPIEGFAGGRAVFISDDEGINIICGSSYDPFTPGTLGRSLHFRSEDTSDLVAWFYALTNSGTPTTVGNAVMEGLTATQKKVDGELISEDTKERSVFYKPVRLPRMSTAQRDELTSTNDGDLIFNTTLEKVQVYVSTEWKTLAFET